MLSYTRRIIMLYISWACCCSVDETRGTTMMPLLFLLLLFVLLLLLLIALTYIPWCVVDGLGGRCLYPISASKSLARRVFRCNTNYVLGTFYRWYRYVSYNKLRFITQYKQSRSNQIMYYGSKSAQQQNGEPLFRSFFVSYNHTVCGAGRGRFLFRLLSGSFFFFRRYCTGRRRIWFGIVSGFFFSIMYDACRGRFYSSSSDTLGGTDSFFRDWSPLFCRIWLCSTLRKCRIH